jgi:hypothetical protein
MIESSTSQPGTSAVLQPEQTNRVKSKRFKNRPGEGAEAQAIQKRLAGFDAATSQTWNLIRAQLSSHVTQPRLLSVARLLCERIKNLRLDRAATRHFGVLIKWFHENWEKIAPHFQYCHFRDGDGQIITDD